MKSFLNKNLILILVLAVSAGTMLSFVTADSKAEVKAGKLEIQNPAQRKGVFAAMLGNGANQTITSDIINTPDPFNAVAFSWTVSEAVDFHLYVRFEKENWTNWQEVEKDPDLTDNNSQNKNVSNLTFAPYTNILQYRISLANSSDADKITALQIDYIDSTKGASAKYSIATNDIGLKIITRGEWGANESYGIDPMGNEAWPKTYLTPNS